MTLWYYDEGGQQRGPVEDGEFRGKITRQEIGPQTLVWREGLEGWRPLVEVAELSLMAPAGGYYGTGYAGNYVQSSGLAVASLVCGIFGIVGLVFCVGVVAGIPAVICGHMALRQIANAQVPMGGRGMAIAGLIMGYLQVLGMVALVIGIAVSVPWR